MVVGGRVLYPLRQVVSRPPLTYYYTSFSTSIYSIESSSIRCFSPLLLNNLFLFLLWFNDCTFFQPFSPVLFLIFLFTCFCDCVLSSFPLFPFTCYFFIPFTPCPPLSIFILPLTYPFVVSPFHLSLFTSWLLLPAVIWFPESLRHMPKICGYDFFPTR